MRWLFLLTVLTFSTVYGQLGFYIYKVETDYQNWHRNKYTFMDGSYYSYVGRIVSDDSVKTLFLDLDYSHPELIIGYLFGKGITIKEAWYNLGSSSCGNLDVMVFPSLSIQVDDDKQTDLLLSLGFMSVNKPVIDCPYSVKHYKFVLKSE